MKFRFIRGCLIPVAIVLLAAVLVYILIQPSPTTRTEIYRGVYLTVEELPGTGEQVMVVEAHWDHPGVTISNREFSFPVKTGDPFGPHYKLAIADFALARENAGVLVNTTLFEKLEDKGCLPGTPVRSSETLVVDGKISHVHANSYLLYLDDNKEAGVTLNKPPRTSTLGKAVTGIGLQGVQVYQGLPRYQAIGDLNEPHARTFIGVDPEKKVLFLIAFEKATGREMIDYAIGAGVIDGGQVDSGNSTNLLIGSKAKGVRPHTGIRHCRPIGPYLTIQAEPLS